MKVSELEGAALDRAVSHCVEWSKPFPIMPLKVKPYSTDWAQAGPIIEREKIDVISDPNGTAGWMGRNWVNSKEVRLFGPTPLIAAMRTYVASKLGREIEIPEDLL